MRLKRSTLDLGKMLLINIDYVLGPRAGEAEPTWLCWRDRMPNDHTDAFSSSISTCTGCAIPHPGSRVFGFPYWVYPSSSGRSVCCPPYDNLPDVFSCEHGTLPNSSI